jgi:hypothetical protein
MYYCFVYVLKLECTSKSNLLNKLRVSENRMLKSLFEPKIEKATSCYVLAFSKFTHEIKPRIFKEPDNCVGPFFYFST